MPRWGLSWFLGTVLLGSGLGCFEFVGGLGDECSQQNLCLEGLGCLDGRCVDVLEACSGRICGSVGMIQCGMCPEGRVCEANQCILPCDNRQCGEYRGFSCGTCDFEERCEQNQCVPFCQGRCGMVDGRDCGGCADASAICNNNACVAGVLDCPGTRPYPPREDGWVQFEQEKTITNFAEGCNGWVALAHDDATVSMVDLLGDGPPLTYSVQQPASLMVHPNFRQIVLFSSASQLLQSVDIETRETRQLSFQQDVGVRIHFEQGPDNLVYLIKGTSSSDADDVALLDMQQWRVLTEFALPDDVRYIQTSRTRPAVFTTLTGTVVEYVYNRQTETFDGVIEHAVSEATNRRLALHPNDSIVVLDVRAGIVGQGSARQYTLTQPPMLGGEYQGTDTWDFIAFTPGGDGFVGWTSSGFVEVYSPVNFLQEWRSPSGNNRLFPRLIGRRQRVVMGVTGFTDLRFIPY